MAEEQTSLEEQVRRIVTGILSETPILPPVPPGGQAITEITIRPSGEVTIRVTPVGAALAPTGGFETFALESTPCDECGECGECGENQPPPPAASLAAPAEALAQQILGTTSMTRSQLMAELWQRTLSSELEAYARELGIQTDQA